MFQSTPGVKRIFYINVSVFVILSILNLSTGIDIRMIFACWNLHGTNFHWYQLITSQFVHGGVFHILGNMMAAFSRTLS
jgi:membrane associated rhomboid family serine protease